MVVLKHLAQQYQKEPKALRQVLRNKFGSRGSWRWKDPNDTELRKIRSYLDQLYGDDSSKSPSASPTTRSSRAKTDILGQDQSQNAKKTRRITKT